MREALDALFPRWDGLAVAGRTDTGVHATGQVASVDVEGGPPPGARGGGPEHRSPGRRRGPRGRGGARRTSTPDSPPAPARTATASSRGRRARRSRPGACSGGRGRSTLDALAAAAALLPGEHDFRAFTPSDTQHESFSRNVLAASWEQDGDRLDFTVEADSFLRHMVRTLVGTMLEAGPTRPIRMRRAARGPPALGGGPDGAARGASISSASATDCAARRRGYDRAVRSPCASRRPLRPRRHADRLGADHPGLDAARDAHRARTGDRVRGAGGHDRWPGPRGADAGARRRTASTTSSRRTGCTTIRSTTRSRRSTRCSRCCRA